MLSVYCQWLTAVLLGLSIVSASADTLSKIEHIVIIYGENRSFDNLYGLFSGANGVQNLNVMMGWSERTGLEAPPVYP